MKLEVNIATLKGMDSQKNEDCCLCKMVKKNVLLAVLTDGMGGLSFGDYVSQLIVRIVVGYVEKNMDIFEPRILLSQAVNEANRAISTECYRRKCKMGAAVTILLIIDNIAYYTSLGNVRLYINSQDDFIQLTEDNVYQTSYSSFLTKCLNGRVWEEEIQVNTITTDFVSRFLLCSDGCYMTVPKNELSLPGVDITAYKDKLQDDSSFIEITYSNHPYV